MKADDFTVRQIANLPIGDSAPWIERCCRVHCYRLGWLALWDKPVPNHLGLWITSKFELLKFLGGDDTAGQVVFHANLDTF